MDDQPSIADGMAEAAILLMLRAGLIDPGQIVSVADEYDVRADRDRYEDEAERLRGVAHQLRLLSIDFDPPTPAEDEVAARRREMRERTARLGESHDI